MHDKEMECPKCHGSAEASGGSDDGIHYLCLKCGCAFVFDIKTLKMTLVQGEHTTIPAMADGLKVIHESIQRHKGSFELVQAPEGFALAAGSHRAVKVDGGFIVCITLSKEQMEYLKAQCEQALAQKG